jgi:hypothetical protein
MSRESIGILVTILLIIPFLIKAWVKRMFMFFVVVILATFLGFNFSHVPSPSSNGLANFNQRSFPTLEGLLTALSPDTIAKSQEMRSENANLGIWSYLNENSIQSETYQNLQTKILFIADFLMAGIRPLPIEENLSTVATFASLENLFWILLFSFFSITSFRIIKSKERKLFFVCLITFFFVSNSLLIIYSGSLGTYFRHKSNFLGIILLVLSQQKGRIRV